ncbi:hypothetical protein B277_04387 [Janibacter hoylei PVAS-1]|uniref:DUF1990 domain-containing protein n=1 Tax=Janibacter hoylei PVAS-1 TaxID=1210046 RepID=K1E955_9MICO|nr:hypothetical protein B277_04387 [Janibacter hoylei PVAS-1]
MAPGGFAELRRSRRVGSGLADFERAADALLTWQMHRRATASHERVETGAVAELRLGVGRLGLRAPVRVVDVVDEPTRRGFAYGTLPGHPEGGEESFVVELGETGDVTLTITAVSRPSSRLARLAGQVGRRVQSRITDRYLSALADDEG